MKGGMLICRFVLALSISACVAEPDLGSHTRNAVDAFIWFKSNVGGEPAGETKDGQLIEIDLLSGTGRLVTHCQSLFCQVVDVSIAPHTPNAAFQGAWQVSVPGNDQWHGELVVRSGQNGTDALLAKAVNLEALTGEANLGGGADDWYFIAPSTEVQCVLPCEEPPDGFECIPVCTLCPPLSKTCL